MRAWVPITSVRFSRRGWRLTPRNTAILGGLRSDALGGEEQFYQSEQHDGCRAKCSNDCFHA